MHIYKKLWLSCLLTSMLASPCFINQFFLHVVLQRILCTGANVDTRENNGWTALIIAAHLGHSWIAEALITAGMDHKLNSNVLLCMWAYNLSRVLQIRWVWSCLLWGLTDTMYLLVIWCVHNQEQGWTSGAMRVKQLLIMLKMEVTKQLYVYWRQQMGSCKDVCVNMVGLQHDHVHIILHIFIDISPVILVLNVLINNWSPTAGSLNHGTLCKDNQGSNAVASSNLLHGDHILMTRNKDHCWGSSLFSQANTSVTYIRIM